MEARVWRQVEAREEAGEAAARREAAEAVREAEERARLATLAAEDKAIRLQAELDRLQRRLTAEQQASRAVSRPARRPRRRRRPPANPPQISRHRDAVGRGRSPPLRAPGGGGGGGGSQRRATRRPTAAAAAAARSRRRRRWSRRCARSRRRRARRAGRGRGAPSPRLASSRVGRPRSRGHRWAPTASPRAAAAVGVAAAAAVECGGGGGGGGGAGGDGGDGALSDLVKWVCIRVPRRRLAAVRPHGPPYGRLPSSCPRACPGTPLLVPVPASARRGSGRRRPPTRSRCGRPSCVISCGAASPHRRPPRTATASLPSKSSPAHPIGWRGARAADGEVEAADGDRGDGPLLPPRALAASSFCVVS